MPTTSSLDTERRRRALATLIEQRGSVSFVDAAEALAVSEMTIRRDLRELEAEGLARRVRGGAIMPLGPQRFSVRSAQRSDAKASIARKALDLVPRHGAVALDASTTVGALAMLLGERESLTVVTNSWENFSCVRRAGAVHAVLTGGEVDIATDSLVGPIACRAAAALSYATLFASASGVDPGVGTTDVSLAEAQVKQEFARSSERVVLLADSSKLGERDIARSFSWDDIDLLVTELDPEDPALRPFRGLVELR